MDANVVRILDAGAYLLLLWLGAKVKEVGFEHLISQPVIEARLAVLKPYQPYIVVGVAIGLAYVLGLDVTQVINAVVPVAQVEPTVAHALTGVVLGVLTIKQHETKTKPSG